METPLNSVWVAPWGGKGGAPWKFEIPACARLTEIVIKSGDVVDSIGFTYIEEGQGIPTTATYGGKGGIAHKIKFAEAEKLLGISGTFDTYYGVTVVHSLSFVTNATTYGPYGTHKGTDFSIHIEQGWFAAFKGRAGDFLDSFGVIVQP